MNLRVATVAALVLIAGGATAFLLTHRTRPLVENGGFEGPTFSGWDHDDGSRVVADAGRGSVASSAADGSLRLSQEDRPVHKGRTYRLDVWLRAQGAASLTLTTWEKDGRKDARRAAVWEDLPSEWTRFSAYVTPSHDGKLSFELTAPPQPGERPPLVYVDDVSLTEVTLPSATQVEPGKGFDDEPSMARAADGTLYVAWLSWRDGTDSLQVARYAAKPDGTFEELGTWAVDGGPQTSLLTPRVIPFGLGAAVAYVTQQGSRCKLETASCTAIGVELPVERSSSDHRCADPGAASVNSRLWITGTREIDGVRHIFIDWGGSGSSAGAARDEKSKFAPALASDGSCLAWHSGIEGNFDVVVESPPGVSTWNADFTRQLTHASTIDRSAVLLPRNDEMWLLYENVETPGYRLNEETARHVVVAKIDGDKLLAPRNYMATSPLWDHAESPTAAFDDKGRLWVAYRKPRPPTAGWDVFLTGWTGNAWVPPIPVSTMKGMNRAPSLVLDGRRAIVCFQADDLPESWGEIDRNAEATSGVYLTSIELPDVPAAPHELEPLVENPAKWEAAEIRKRFGDDNPTKHETTVGGDNLTLLFGDLHSHSDTSVCDRLQNGSADDVYAMQRDFLHLDFACLTDHAEDMNPYLWNRQAKLARANDVPGRFTTFLGFEWTSGYDGSKPEGWFGHRNVILGDLRFPRWWSPRDHQTPAQLWAELRAANANFVTIPHQLADTGNVPTDWSFVDETAQPVAEIFQVRGSYEAPGEPRVGRKATASADHFLQGALKQGIVVGVIASPDHGGGVGKACVWAKENSREAILDALRARRCYGTTGARIVLEFRAGGHFMGERTTERAAAGTVPIHVRMSCPGKVAKVSLCRSGAWVKTWTPGKDGDVEITATDEAPAGPKWYYVRVEQEDGEMAWSSPVWLGAAK